MDDEKNIPKHVAIILDGNGRWAKLRGMPRSYGHKVGFDKVKTISFYAQKVGIKYLSLFCFSTENWNRPTDEVNFLMSIPITFNKDSDSYLRENIKVVVSGRRGKTPDKTQAALDNLVDKTKNCTGLILNICFDYGALDDLTRAVNEIIDSHETDIRETAIYSRLSTHNVPPVDLLIRTGGEKRLSNFLLLESAYAELYFTDTYWPDFSESDLDNALSDYAKRDRRFGGIKK